MENIFAGARADDGVIAKLPGARLQHPELDANYYYRQVASEPYFLALSLLRHHVRSVSDYYFSRCVDAKNIDLFLMTSSVSSPAGMGSDSEPIPLTFGGLNTYLVDSSQFGFEPILMCGLARAYCYLCSMRGELPDARHLNQFYHCEYEAQEEFEETRSVAEGYVRILGQLLDNMPNAIDRLSSDPLSSRRAVRTMLAQSSFQSMTFDEALYLLREHRGAKGIRETSAGNDLTEVGEIHLLEILGSTAPIWITNYPRDRVPFYQKPLLNNSARVMNADLLCPPISQHGFGGEVLGMGQRQDTVEEMYESMHRQGVEPKEYEWYIDLRRQPNYRTTSGFGLGIERFISWILGLDSIHKAILYPRLKGVKIVP